MAFAYIQQAKLKIQFLKIVSLGINSVSIWLNSIITSIDFYIQRLCQLIEASGLVPVYFIVF